MKFPQQKELGVNVYVPADNVWSFFQNNIARLTNEMVAIAENVDTKYAVYLTEDKGYPSFSVCKGDSKPEYTEGAISEADCTETAKRCYVRFLFPVMVTYDKGFPKSSFQEMDDGDEEDLTEQDRQDNVYVREDELQLAMCDFLKVALNLDCDPVEIVNEYGVDLVTDVLDTILEYIGLEHGLEIYRPMFLTDEDSGSEIYTEYPYDITAETHVASRFEENEDEGKT